MSNGQNPLKPEKNQLLFFNPETDNIEFGMNAMFNPISGRLSYGYGRILCVFSYMNHFGLTREGEREDNNGDTVVTYSEDGTQVHLVQSWSTTHSLCQRCVYNGNYFFQCSLGDAAPANINLLRIDPKVKLKLDTKNKFSDSYKSSKFQGSFNSNNSKGSLNNNKNINKNNIYQPEIKFEHYLNSTFRNCKLIFETLFVDYKNSGLNHSNVFYNNDFEGKLTEIWRNYLYF